MPSSESAAAQDRELLAQRRPRGCVDGRYGVREHLLYEDGGIVRCAHCEGEEAARQARLAEKGIYVGRFR